MGNKSKHQAVDQTGAFRGSAGVSTWKLLAIAAVTILVAGIGAYSIQTEKGRNQSAEAVFDFNVESTQTGAPDANGG